MDTDNLELNKGDNFIFCIDVSSSMSAADCPGNMTRIEYLKERTISFVNEASKWDDDGVDILKFGHKVTSVGKASAGNAESLIKPLRADEGATCTAEVIAEAYRMHVAGKYKQTVCMIATDGAPSNKDKVKDVIRDIASKLGEEHEFAISFLTVGEISSDLQAFLTELDDDLKAKHDIVDVKQLDQVDFMTAFVGALHD